MTTTDSIGLHIEWHKDHDQFRVVDGAYGIVYAVKPTLAEAEEAMASLTR